VFLAETEGLHTEFPMEECDVVARLTRAKKEALQSYAEKAIRDDVLERETLLEFDRWFDEQLK
jgi:hypothetical protein